MNRTSRLPIVSLAAAILGLSVPSTTSAQDTAAAVTTKPPLNLKVIDGLEIPLGDHSISYLRVEPPSLLPPRRAQSLPRAPVLTLQETAAAEARARKKIDVLFLSATVFDHRATELRWTFGNREYRGWSNVDFNLLAGTGEIETNDAIYSLLMGIGNETAESLAASDPTAAAIRKAEMRAVFRLAPARAAYILAPSETPVPPEALAAIDALHRYCETNRARLTKDIAKREAATAEREQWLRDHPPEPQDTVVNFWPKKSLNSPTSSK